MAAEGSSDGWLGFLGKYENALVLHTIPFFPFSTFSFIIWVQPFSFFCFVYFIEKNSLNLDHLQEEVVYLDPII
jgi:hypothetical protein